ncbi:DUF4288 domain-containing protein [Planctomyces sp. SH-PL14]|uniref:DUF4288 domain-containing protein n=1 Tax=Planctomyces sp. SH-PL14 TaxID=1632864 RepID=UPI00078CA7C5|nr:DUF4288 domain-containing protein [Planctomyces sp. SH-PL14]AMV17842.1 hypothetical protein VT03_08110 [Planctomyces sp. SH-PL14]
MSRADKTTAEDRFSATLLFQYRVAVDGRDNRNRTCEKRMLLLRAADAGSALRVAEQRGRAAEYEFQNEAGHSVYFEFVGLLDLLHLGAECEADEVWYDIVTLRQPMERRESLIPKSSQLAAIAGERKASRPGPR